MKPKIGQKIRQIRKLRGMSQLQLSIKSGINQGQISNIERDIYPNPGIMSIKSIAKALNVSLDEILGENAEIHNVPIPIISRAVASPKGAYFTDQDYPAGAGEDYWQVDDPDAFAIRVEGTSMEPTVREGDMIIVTPNKTPVTSQIALVRLVESGKTFLKRVEIHGDDVILKSDNHDFETLVHKRQEIDWMYRVEAIIPR